MKAIGVFKRVEIKSEPEVTCVWVRDNPYITYEPQTY